MIKDTNRIYSIIAGACFALLAAFACISFFSRYVPFVQHNLPFWSVTYNIKYCIEKIIDAGFCLVFAITMFLSKKHIAEVIAAGAVTILSAYLAIEYISYIDSTATYFLYCIIDFLAAAALTYLTVAFCIPSIASKVSAFKRIAQRIWFLPAALLLISSIFYYIWWFLYAYDNSFLVFLKLCGVTLIFDIIEIAAYLFAGLWLSGGKFAVKREKSAAVPNTVKIGGADRLKICKELLDEGVITQDELDKKKKQILGL
ncbi:MAG: SHOCT domain-containing protein [Oscillospiraceae bacterium]|nr:SHOCT domain-containing protein [Oscillospiraceae bacterium]